MNNAAIQQQHLILLNQTLSLLTSELIRKDNIIRNVLVESERLNNRLIELDNANKEMKKTIEAKDSTINEFIDTIFVYEMKFSELKNK